jgi:hypothetical protein
VFASGCSCSSRVDGHEKRYRHNVLIDDPWRDMPKPEHADKFRENLVKPYKTLQGFKDFEFTGIPTALAKAISKEVTSPIPKKTPSAVLAELEAMKTKGNDAWRNNSQGEANNFWCDAIHKIHTTLNGKAGKDLFAIGGVTFQQSIISLEFTLYSNIVQARLHKIREMKGYGAPPHIIFDLGERFFELLHVARICRFGWEDGIGEVWKPTALQMANLSFQEASACREIGRRDLLERAKAAIADVLSALPDDRSVLEEWNQIKQWRKRTG